MLQQGCRLKSGHLVNWKQFFSSSRSQVFLRIAFQKKCAKFTGNTCDRVFFNCIISRTSKSYYLGFSDINQIFVGIRKLFTHIYHTAAYHFLPFSSQIFQYWKSFEGLWEKLGLHNPTLRFPRYKEQQRIAEVGKSLIKIVLLCHMLSFITIFLWILGIF